MPKIRGGRLGRAIYNAIVIEPNPTVPGGGLPIESPLFRSSGYEDGGFGDTTERGWTPRSLSWSSIPAAYAAVNLLAASLARLDMEVGRVNTDGLFERDPDHLLNVLLKYPNPAYDRWQFWEATFRCYLAGGNSYSFVMKDTDNTPLRLVPSIATNSKQMADGTVKRDLQFYTKTDDPANRKDSVDDSEIVSIHGPDFDGIRASSPITTAAYNVLTTVHLGMMHQRNTLKGGIHSKGVIQQHPELAGSQTDDARVREEWAAEFSGVVNAGKTPFLPPGMEWKDIGGFSAVDLQLIELLKFNVEDIARIFGVPPRLLQHFHEGARVSQVFESQSEDFARYSIQPHAERIGAQLTKKLLTNDETSAGMEIRVNTDTLRAGTFTERAMAADLLAAKAGVVTINEARRMLGYEPHPEGNKLLEPKGAPAQDKGNDSNQNGNSKE